MAKNECISRLTSQKKKYTVLTGVVAVLGIIFNHSFFFVILGFLLSSVALAEII